MVKIESLSLHSKSLPSSVQLLINIKLAVAVVSESERLLVVIFNAYYVQGISVKKTTVTKTKNNQQIHENKQSMQVQTTKKKKVTVD